MTTINAATIYAEVLAHRLALAQTIAELEPAYLPAYARLAGTKTELYLGDAVKRAVPSLVTIKTSARGSMRIANTLYRLDSFAAIVKSKAAIFGTGFTAAMRAGLWAIGTLHKYKFFPVGVKDKPRHPVYLGPRSALDL